MHVRNRVVLALAAAASLSAPPIATAADVTFTANLPTGQPVGTSVEWTVSGTGIGSLDTRLSVLRAGDPPGGYPFGMIMYDYGARMNFDWTPLRQGDYTITAEVRDNGDGSITTLRESFSIVPVPGSTAAPVVSSTRHPLVALYSAPACSPGRLMRVLFKGAYPGARQYQTDAKPCVAGETMNFYVAGMRASKRHSMQYQLETPEGQVIRVSRRSSFTTGAIDTPVPTPNIVIPLGPDTSVEDSIVMSAPVGGQGVNVVAADIDGQVVWYYKPIEGGDFSYRRLTRWNDGGTFFTDGPSAEVDDRHVLRELDLAGNTVRETNSRRVAEMLQELGRQVIGYIHHEIRRLPDGHIALLGSVERLLQDVQGPGWVDVLGDAVIVLDESMQVAWSVNLFDILDVTRLATGGETCVNGSIICPGLLLADIANDWTHSNAISYSPADGNLIVSMRNQDWVIKVDYRDGAGDGGLIWRLGEEGDFTPLGFPGDTDPWFTHQHDANYLGSDRLINFDNGNRSDACLTDRHCRSRGQVWTLDESNMTATLDTNADLGDYSSGLGAAEALSNGNYNFNSGLPGGLTVPLSRLDEVLPNGTKVFSMEFNERAYRGFRLRDLYTAPSYD